MLIALRRRSTEWKILFSDIVLLVSNATSIGEMNNNKNNPASGDGDQQQQTSDEDEEEELVLVLVLY